MEKAGELYKKYKEEIHYLFFGVLTTLVNQGVFWLGLQLFPFGKIPTITMVAWLVSVIFAFFTNRKWVFDSKAKGVVEILKEGGAFFGGRLFSGGVDVALVSFLVATTTVNPNVIKLGSNVLVVILNYIMSKLIIFRKRED